MLQNPLVNCMCCNKRNQWGKIRNSLCQQSPIQIIGPIAVLADGLQTLLIASRLLEVGVRSRLRLDKLSFDGWASTDAFVFMSLFVFNDGTAD